MRLLLRRAGLTLSAGLLIFCCSCERHHVGELPDHGKKDHGDAHATNEHAHAPASPGPRNSPADFFPDKPKP